ncbi:MAG: bile acid:sodium symporter family protein [Rhodobacteraceae bacterium]|nr:bile acid:sodium symporter family protein [Paracoccaceae bacterium]
MGNFLVDVVLPLILAFIMFTLGLGLRPGDFMRVFLMPRAFATGFVNQMVLLPIAGFALAHLIGLTPELAVGVMILVLCPGGVTTNVLAKIAGGNTALSISLTAVVTVVVVFTMPLILYFSVRTFMGTEAPPVNTPILSITMFLMTVVPVAIGMVVTALAPGGVAAAGTILSRIAVALFALIVLAAIAANLEVLRDNIVSLGPALFILMALMLALGLVTARLVGLASRDATTIAIETGVQNATLGIAVAAILADQILVPGEGLSAFALPAATYGILMYVLAIPFALWRRGCH